MIDMNSAALAIGAIGLTVGAAGAFIAFGSRHYIERLEVVCSSKTKLIALLEEDLTTLARQRDELRAADLQRREQRRIAGMKGNAVQQAAAQARKAEQASDNSERTKATLAAIGTTLLRPREEVVAGVRDGRKAKGSSAGVAAKQG